MSTKTFFIRHKILLSIVLFFLISLRVLLLKIPLFKNLDLELAIVYALLFSILSSFLGLYFLKRNEKIWHIFVVIFSIVFLLTFIFLLFELLMNKCPVNIGILFFPLFTVTAAFFGLSSALIFNLFEGLKSWLLLLCTYSILFAYSLLVYYFEPQLFLFNPIFVFFPGLVHNEIFEIDLRIIIYTTVISFSSLLIIMNFILKEFDQSSFYQKFEIHLKLIPIFLLVLLFLSSDMLGLSTSQKKLDQNFPNYFYGDGFELYFENSNLKTIEKDIYHYSVDFHYQQLKKNTRKAPKKIKIYIFKDEDSKNRLLGDKVADFTKPWQTKIFVTESSFHETIKHELAHVFLGEASDNIFKVAGYLNLGLIEGGAMALEWEWSENSPEFYAALINRFIGKFNASDFFSNYSFATRQSYLSYILSGSFCKYLIDTYGLEKFLELYRTAEFESVYQKNMQDEFENFLNKLGNYSFSEQDSLTAFVLFGGKTIFEKRCPRAIARMGQKAKELIDIKDFTKAEKLMQKVYDQSKDIEAFSTLIRIKFLQKEYKNVVQLYRNSKFYNQFNGLSSVRVKIIYALSLVKIGESDEAAKILESLKSLKLSTSWNSYINLFVIFLMYPQMIELISEKPASWLEDIFYWEINEAWLVWKYLIDYLSLEQLDVVVQNSSENFWTLRRCFYRYLKLDNFEGANKVINLIQTNNLVSNEVEKYQYDLMKYILLELN